MQLTLKKIDSTNLGQGDHQYRYIIHITSDVRLSLTLIELWYEKMGENLKWKSIERNRVNPYEVILVVEKSLNFKSVAKEKVARWLEIMTEIAAAR